MVNSQHLATQLVMTPKQGSRQLSAHILTLPLSSYCAVFVLRVSLKSLLLIAIQAGQTIRNKKLVLVERYRFYSYKQLERQSLSDYTAELCHLMATCNWSAEQLEDNMLTLVKNL